MIGSILKVVFGTTFVLMVLKVIGVLPISWFQVLFPIQVLMLFSLVLAVLIGMVAVATMLSERDR